MGCFSFRKSTDMVDLLFYIDPLSYLNILITDKFRKCIKTNQARPEISFHSRRRLGLRASNCPAVQRQIQFPLIVPGRFIRQFPSRLSRSWRGVIAKEDYDIQASRVRFAAMFSSLLSKPSYLQTFRRSSGEASFHHPRVVLLSWVPV